MRVFIIQYLGSHGSSYGLCACDRMQQRYLADGTVWVKLKSFMDAVVAKCMTTFGPGRIVEWFKTDHTLCI